MTGVVYVVDDDEAMRSALCRLIEADGMKVECYADGPAFLAAAGPGCSGCVVLDLTMPGMDGRQVQAALKERGEALPVVFLTGHGDVATAVEAVQAGAVDFLEKPVQAPVLLERVRRALALGEDLRRQGEQEREVRRRHARLSPREREVMTLVVSGLSSKLIARELDLSPRTVEVHRANLMHKMGAGSLAELVTMARVCEP